MVGQLKEVFKALVDLRDRAKRLYGEIGDLERMRHSNGGGKVSEMLGERRRALEEASGEIEAHIQPLRERGVIVKSIEEGLVDFPFLRQGQVVYLCWRVGETEIGYWHDLTTGFAGRQPL